MTAEIQFSGEIGTRYTAVMLERLPKNLWISAQVARCRIHPQCGRGSGTWYVTSVLDGNVVYRVEGDALVGQRPWQDTSKRNFGWTNRHL